MALTDNLLRYFKMEDNAANTTVVDSTGTANGTNAANTSGKTVGGRVNNALDFNGSSDSVNLGSGISINGNDAFTFNVWVYPTASANGNAIVISPDGANNLQIQCYIAAGAIYYQRGANYVEKLVTLSLNTWTMLTITYDGTNIRGYRNATEESTSPVASAGSISAGTNNARIGRAANVAGAYFQGRIDEVGIWSRALSGAEITQLYNSGNGLTYPFANNYTQSVDEALTLVDSISKGAGKSLNEVVTLVDTQTKAMTKSLNEVATLVDTLTANMFYGEEFNEALPLNDITVETKTVGKTLEEVVTVVDTITRDVTRILNETAVLVDSISQQVSLHKTFDEALALVDTIQKHTGKSLAELIELVDSISFSAAYARTLDEVATLVDSISKGANKVLNDAVTLVDTLSRVGTFARTLDENVTLVEYFQGLINGINIRWFRKYASKAVSFSNKYATKTVTWVRKYLDMP